MYEHFLTPPEQGQMDNHWWNRKSRKVRTSHWTAVTKTELMISSSGRQDPREGIHFLVQLFLKEEEKSRGRFTAKLNKNDQQFSLHVEDSQLHDASTFLCATGTQCSSDTCAPHLNTAKPAPPAWRAPRHWLCSAQSETRRALYNSVKEFIWRPCAEGIVFSNTI